MNKDLTYIAVILDRSGSMAWIKDATKEGLDVFIETQKQTPGDALFTLVQFDDRYEVHAWEKKLSDVKYEYNPRGGTALLDAIGKTINDVGASLAARSEDNRPAKVMLVVVTDGEENASREFTHEKVFEMITHQRDTYSWEFVFLGANQDAIKAGTALGIHAQSSMTYSSNDVGTRAAFATLGETSTNFRGGVTKSAVIDNHQRKSYAVSTNTPAAATPVDLDSTNPANPKLDSTP